MKNLFRYLRSYPLSFALASMVLLLTFIRPPEVDAPQDMDKWVHILMYAGLSGIFWYEYLRAYAPATAKRFRPVRAFLFATLAPTLLGLLTEYLQGLLTEYRTADPMDAVMNVSGVFLATLFSWFVLRPYLHRSSELPD
jgi:VanZ family protein